MDIIVEIGNSHEGSLGIAKSFIDMAMHAGAKTVKFQMHMAEFEATSKEPFRVNFSSQDKTRKDYWNRVSFSKSQWTEISQYTNDLGLEFLCTPFSIEAAERLLDIGGIKRWKIGSGDAANLPLIDHLVDTKLPLVISTGLISWDEILFLRNRLIRLEAWNRTTLMHCVSAYPTELEWSSLNQIDELKKLGCNVGLSDHSGRISTALYAMRMGISTLEIHMSPHKLFFGPDTSSSLTPEQIRHLVDVSKDWNIIDSNPKSKNQLFDRVQDIRPIFRKGIYWKKQLSPGQMITYDDIAFLKPVVDVDSFYFEDFLGKRVSIQTQIGEPVHRNDIEELNE